MRIVTDRRNPALTLNDFRELRQGAVLTLHYHCVNQGTFTWEHDRVEGDRVFGRFVYEGEVLADIPVDGYLYECGGVVCRGSGAEPVHRRMPARADRWAEDGPGCPAIEAHGVRGLDSKPFRRVFKSQAAFEAWLQKNEGSVEVHATREVEG